MRHLNGRSDAAPVVDGDGRTDGDPPRGRARHRCRPRPPARAGTGGLRRPLGLPAPGVAGARRHGAGAGRDRVLAVSSGTALAGALVHFVMWPLRRNRLGIRSWPRPRDWNRPAVRLHRHPLRMGRVGGAVDPARDSRGRRRWALVGLATLPLQQVSAARHFAWLRSQAEADPAWWNAPAPRPRHRFPPTPDDPRPVVDGVADRPRRVGPAGPDQPTRDPVASGAPPGRPTASGLNGDQDPVSTWLPASTSRRTPVIDPASSESRNATAAATSSASVSRPSSSRLPAARPSSPPQVPGGLGPGQARADRVDPDPTSAEVVGQGAGQGVQRRLGRGVGGHRRRGLLGRPTGDVDHRTPPSASPAAMAAWISDRAGHVLSPPWPAGRRGRGRVRIRRRGRRRRR